MNSTDEIAAPEPAHQQPTTLPDGVSVCLRAFASDEHAQSLGSTIRLCVLVISRRINLSNLDGVTVAYDYPQALLELDRGYETTFRLTPSETHAVGIAMAPSVIRDGSLKSHIVLNAEYMTALEDFDNEYFGSTLHTLAHECAHVEITHMFDTAFPNTLLRTTNDDALVGYRWSVILACWDEYAATMRSAGIGIPPTVGYEDTFLRVLHDTKRQANDYIKAYRVHGQIEQVMGEVGAAYSALLKYTAYHLGNLRGLGLTVADMPRSSEALEGHWFQPYVTRLDDTLKAIEKDYGKWTNKSAFEIVGDLAEELLVQNGIHCEIRPDGQLYVDIPFTAETVPSSQEVAQLTAT